MKKGKRYIIFFIIGGVGYALIELLWRGRTHWSMMLAGGICFVLFALITRWMKGLPLLAKAVTAATAVTLVELVFGIIFNIVLGLGVWDYSNVPFNFLGQICLLFSVLWGFLALIFLPIAEMIDKRIT